ncbi:MAG: hypothetical protein P4L99_26120 [Chthoniobacter sp.]|nr:hypothetical protein [Chthoniobacter sp.]
MADDFYGYDEAEAEPKGHDNLFLWTIFILLLIGAAFACWMGSFWVFGHPEKPKAYQILLKLKKLDAPLRFEVTAAPPGEFLTASKLFERYSKFSRLELENENGELLRNYIRNYRETKKLVTYVTGRYVILDSTELKPSDMFPSGMVALAQAAEFPQVVIEHVYTTPPRNVPVLRTLLQTGMDMKLERTNDLSAVIHVERIPDGRMQFTVVPLLYGTYALKQGSGTFSLEPPPTLNMVPGLPVMKGQSMEEGLRKFANYRRDHPMPSTDATAGDPNATKPEIVRVDVVEPGKTTPETGPLPQPGVATPMPIAGQPTPRFVASAQPTPLRVPTPTPRQLVTMIATPTPRPVMQEAPAITPLPASATPLPRTSPDGVPLQPFIAAQRDPNMNSTGATWRTYAPGQAPPARGISLDEVGSLADRGDVGERLYLRGEFRVTASGTSRAVLRDATRPDDQSPRIVVEYPAGAVPPQEKDRFVRDAARPYLISDIRRGADGVVTIYVREIIK